MKVQCKLNSYDSLDETREDALTVESDWTSYSDNVILKIGDEKVTVNASQLINATENCTNR